MCSVHCPYPPCLRSVQQLHVIGGSTDGPEIDNLNSPVHLFSFNVDHYILCMNGLFVMVRKFLIRSI